MEPTQSTVFNRLLTGAGQKDSDITEETQANIMEGAIWSMTANAATELQKLNAQVAATATKNQVSVTEQLINAYA